jgi:hypothetical protein
MVENFHEFQLRTRGMAETHPISTLPRLSIIVPPVQKYTHENLMDFKVDPITVKCYQLFSILKLYIHHFSAVQLG